MAEILIRAVTVAHPDPDKDRRGRYKIGDPVAGFEDGHGWGRKECPPNFIILKVPGVSLATVRDRLESWDSAPTLAVDGFDPVLDVYTVTFTEPLPGVAQENGITREKVEAWVNQWGGTVTGVAAGSVSAEFGVYAAATSFGFWDHPVISFVFQELAYDSGTGVHRVGIDYSATDIKPISIARHIERRGGTVVAHNPVAMQGSFDIPRSAVAAAFKQEVEDQSREVFTRKRYHLSEAVVATALAGDGTVTMTGAEALAALLDKVAGE